MQLTSIVFYATAAVLAIIALTVFCVAAFRKKRKRNAGDVLYLVFGSVVFVAAVVLCLFAVFGYFVLFGFAAESSGNGKFTELIVYIGEKQLFTVPYIGRLANIFEGLQYYGVAVTATVVLLLLISLIALGAKTKRKMSAPAKAVEEKTDEPVTADEEETFASDGSGQRSDLTVHNDIFGEPERIEYEPAEEEELAEEDLPADEQAAEDELAPVDEETAHDIVDEIDRLVTGEHSEPGEEPIDDKLRKAIEEGYDLLGEFDENHADESLPEQEQEAAEPFTEQTEDGEEFTEEEYRPAEEEPAEEEEPPEEEDSLDGWAYEQDNEVAEQEEEDEPSADEERQPAVAAYGNSAEKASEPPADRRVPPRTPVYERAVAADIPVRVRTIVRRPAARSIDEIERRADEILDSGAAGKPTAAKEKPAEKKTPARQKQTAPKPTPKPAPKSALKPTPKPEPKPATGPKKEVEAQSGGLPLTRRYIILNRRSAANIFNEYLQSKRESEKTELTESLNTIIIK